MSQEASSGEVRVVGTAHVSADSVEEVERVIEAERPDVVAVELDEGRFRQLKGETPQDLDASDLLHGNTVFQFLAYWMLSYVQARMGEKFDVTPGADMMAAVDAAEEHGLDVALVDRDIQVTIQRFWARLTGLEKLKLVGSLALGVSDPRTVGLSVGMFVGLFVGVVVEAFAGPLVVPATAGAVAIAVAIVDFLIVGLAIGAAVGAALALLFTWTAPEEDVEDFDVSQLTDRDVVSMMIEEFKQFSPGGAEALIHERDAYIAHQLVGLRERGRNVVAVVGAGHREGVDGYLRSPETLPPMEKLTGQESGSRFSVYRLFGYLFTLGFLVFFLLLAMATVTGVPGASSGLLLRLFGAWFLVNAALAAGLAKLAGAHWTSAGVGGGVAWLTSVNPLLAPGWFAGYVELRYLDVNVADISTLNDLVGDEGRPIRELLADMLDVPLFQLIMVVALTNVGSFLGSVLFATVLIPYMFSEVGGTDEIVRLMLAGARNSLDIIVGAL